MPSIDIRIKTTMLQHPKVQKLKRKLGADGVLGFISLLCFCGEYKTDGQLSGMDNDDIAIASGYNGDTDEYVDTLLSLHLLDNNCDVIAIHDWHEHNPYVSGSGDRSEQARKAANTRWNKDKSDKQDNIDNADVMQEQCGSINQHMPSNANSYAPSPSPDPSPYPKKNTNPVNARPTFNDVCEENSIKGYKQSDDVLREFIAHYDSVDWKTSGGTQIVNWRAAFQKWIIKQHQYDKQKSGRDSPPKAQKQKFGADGLTDAMREFANG